MVLHSPLCFHFYDDDFVRHNDISQRKLRSQGCGVRDDLKQRGIRAVIPPRSNRTKTICYNDNKRLYRQRNRIERALGHL